jgi:hypothetical protein
LFLGNISGHLLSIQLKSGNLLWKEISGNTVTENYIENLRDFKRFTVYTEFWCCTGAGKIGSTVLKDFCLFISHYT